MRPGLCGVLWEGLVMAELSPYAPAPDCGVALAANGEFLINPRLLDQFIVSY